MFKRLKGEIDKTGFIHYKMIQLQQPEEWALMGKHTHRTSEEASMGGYFKMFFISSFVKGFFKKFGDLILAEQNIWF